MTCRAARRIAGLSRAGELTLSDGSCHRVGGGRPGPAAEVTLHRPRAIRRFAADGSLGRAEACRDGDWSTPDLRAVMALAAANEAAGEAYRPARPRIAATGRYDERFRRLRECCLAYCETGFRAGWTDVGRIVPARG